MKRLVAMVTTAAMLAAPAATLLAPAAALAQSAQVENSLDEYVRVLQVQGLATAGTFFLRPQPVATIPDSVGPWAEWLRPAPIHELGSARWTADPARLRMSGNTTVPFGYNDDAMWQGRGLNMALDGGVTLAWGHLTVTAHPTLVFAQNQAFPMAPVTWAGASPYGYPWFQIDLPQRFGPGSFTRLDPGQSSIAVTAHGARLAVGTENLWWGPGIETSILMSNEAPGMPHVSLGTAHPLDIGIGTVEAQWLWGVPQSSGWYDGQDADTSRFFTGAVAAFSPRWAVFRGLTIGAARVFIRNVPPDGLNFHDYMAVVEPITKHSYALNSQAEDSKDQIASFLFRWVMPASNFEMYGEWARNDHGRIPLDILLVPQHSQGYTLGLQKTHALSGNRLVALRGELTHLEQTNTAQRWPDPTYYVHHAVGRGYTQRGQVIGSWVGPGGDAETASVDVYTPRGGWGVYVQRQAHDNDAFYAQSRADTLLAPDVSLIAGARATVFARGLEFGFDAAFSGEADRYFIKDNGVYNLHAAVTVRWRPGSPRR
jgi:hypothetical protein